MEYNADLTKTRQIVRVGPAGREQVEDVLLREDRWRLLCDGNPIATHNCLSLGLEQMAVGQLCYRGIIRSADEIDSVTVDDARKEIRVRLREADPLQETRTRVEAEAEAGFRAGDIHRLQSIFNKRCGLFRYTGSAHSCALADADGVLCYFEDVARHNAMDKVLGEFLLRKMDANGKALFFSGRLALDMLEKSIATGVKVLVSPGAPTLAAVEAAEARDITLLGFVRPDNINIYTGPRRVTD